MEKSFKELYIDIYIYIMNVKKFTMNIYEDAQYSITPKWIAAKVENSLA